MRHNFLMVVFCLFCFLTEDAISFLLHRSLKTRGNNLRLNDYNSLLNIATKITIANFENDVVSQWKRMSVLGRSDISTNSIGLNCSMHVVIIPPGQSMPLHSQPGLVIAKLLYGSITTRYLKISSIEEDLNKLVPAYDLNADAWAGEDDCVCRGGKCPRRQGCVFWVEKQVRDNGAYFMTEESFQILTHETSTRPVIWKFSDGPREYIGGSVPSAVLEIFINEEEIETMEQSVIPQQLLYYQSVPLLDDQGVKSTCKYKVIASAYPNGYTPMWIPFDGRIVIRFNRL